MSITIKQAINEFLFPLQAEGHSPQTHAYYSKLLGCLLRYSISQSQPDNVDKLEVRQLNYHNESFVRAIF